MPAGYKGGPGLPPWKRFQKKGLGRQAEATLESVWMRTQWPSDDTISSMWNLHRVRREQVITWFQEKRRVERGGSPSKEKKEGNNSPGPSTDWDAEWNTVNVQYSNEDGDSGTDDDTDDITEGDDGN